MPKFDVRADGHLNCCPSFFRVFRGIEAETEAEAIKKAEAMVYADRDPSHWSEDLDVDSGETELEIDCVAVEAEYEVEEGS